MKKVMQKTMQKTKHTKLITAALLGALILSGCGSASDMGMAVMDKSSSYMAEQNSMPEAYGTSYDYMSESDGMDSTWQETGAGQAEEVSESAVSSDRKLIRNVNLDVETKDFDGFLLSLEDEVKRLGGYVESMNTYNGSRYSTYRASRNSSLTLRIPKTKLDGFLESISASANIVSRSEDVRDVTLTYVDLESHRNALKTEQERLNALLEKADSLEDIITIEDRLSTVRYQLESMESQLRTYDNQVDYSTVYINVEEVQELTPVEEESTGERIVHGFWNNLKAVGRGLVNFFVWFVVNIPYFAIWIIVIVAIVLIIKGLIHKNRKKKAQKAEKEEKK